MWRERRVDFLSKVPREAWAALGIVALAVGYMASGPETVRVEGECSEIQMVQGGVTRELVEGWWHEVDEVPGWAGPDGEEIKRLAGGSAVCVFLNGCGEGSHALMGTEGELTDNCLENKYMAGVGDSGFLGKKIDWFRANLGWGIEKHELLLRPCTEFDRKRGLDNFVVTGENLWQVPRGSQICGLQVEERVHPLENNSREGGYKISPISLNQRADPGSVREIEREMPAYVYSDSSGEISVHTVWLEEGARKKISVKDFLSKLSLDGVLNTVGGSAFVFLGARAVRFLLRRRLQGR